MARSMIARQNIKLNLVPGGVPPVLNVSQYDSAYDVHFTIYNGAQLFEIPDDVSIQFQETKRDGNGFTVGATKSAQTGQCYIWMQEQMSAVPGDQICELVLTNTTEDQIGTANFIMRVEPAALNKNTVISESEIAYANQVLAQLGSVAAYKAQLDAQGNEIDQLNTNLAAEVAARQAADNTLQSNINSEASTRATADAALQSQINQLVAPEGAAPSAAEVENARVGADGTVYQTLGDAIRGQVTDVKSAIRHYVDQGESVTGVKYVNPDDFDIGNITITTNGWTYAANTTRVRTKQGTTIPLKAGDVISLSDYTAAHAFIGWQRANNTYGAKSWITADYTVTEDGDYVILIESIPASTVTNKNDLIDMLSIKTADNQVDEMDGRLSAVEDLTSDTRNLNTLPVGKYRSTNGVPVATPNVQENFGMSWYIPCSPDTEYTVTFYDITPATGGISATYYDASGTFIRRATANNTAKFTFTTPSNCAFVHCWIYNSAKFTSIENGKVQVELGSGATEYIPPKTAIDYVAREEAAGGVNTVRTVRDINTQLLFNSYVREKPFVNHIGISKTSNIIIPAQSLFDIQRAKRLGYKVMELNTLETSDGALITDHGFSGKWGAQFYSTDDTDLTDVLVSSMTLADIKAKVRYNSIYEKYRVAPPTLEEALKECKRVGIVPLIQWKTGIEEIADAVMGKGNYIAAIYQADRPTGVDGICSSWLTIADPYDVVAKCDASGGAYIAVLNVSNAVYSAFTETDWYNMAKKVHEAGYLIGSAYTSPLLLPILQRAGFDLIIASYNINNIENGNLCNLYGETDFADFTTTGTVADNAVTLATGQSIVPAQTIPTVFLGGGYLSVRFSGDIYVYMGDYLNNAYHFTSDGSVPLEFTTLYENAAPTFRIVAAGATTVYEVVFKSSAM